MAEQTQAVSSPAEVDVFQGQELGFDEYTRYRQTGEVPARLKPVEAESTPADTPEKTGKAEGDEPENDPESDPDDSQEPPENIGRKARRRFDKLLAENKELQRKLEAVAKQDANPGPSPAPTQQQPQQFTRPKPTLQDKNPDGSDRFKTYEEHVEALVDWGAEQRVARYQQEQMQHAQNAQLAAKVEEGKAIYGEDFGAIADEAAGAIGSDQSIPPIVRARLGYSQYLPHLLFTIAGEPDGLASFLKKAKADPLGANDYIALTENLIREELASKGKNKPEEAGAPEKKQTAAPKPPVPVSGGSSRAFDVSDESLSAEEWARKRNADLRKRGKG